MKQEQSFKDYLSNIYISDKTDRSYSPKVVFDIVSRCKKIEKVLNVELSNEKNIDLEWYKNIEIKIKINIDLFGAGFTTKYPHNQYIHALRAYQKFSSR